MSLLLVERLYQRIDELIQERDEAQGKLEQISKIVPDLIEPRGAWSTDPLTYRNNVLHEVIENGKKLMKILEAR